MVALASLLQWVEPLTPMVPLVGPMASQWYRWLNIHQYNSLVLTALIFVIQIFVLSYFRFLLYLSYMPFL